jgi:hypothetical protein
MTKPFSLKIILYKDSFKEKIMNDFFIATNEVIQTLDCFVVEDGSLDGSGLGSIWKEDKFMQKAILDIKNLTSQLSNTCIKLALLSNSVDSVDTGSIIGEIVFHLNLLVLSFL